TALARATGLEAERPRPIARPYPIKPAGELYAEALAAAGDPRSAIQQFRSALARIPNRSSALLGLAQAAQSAGLHAGSTRAAQTLRSHCLPPEAKRRESATQSARRNQL